MEKDHDKLFLKIILMHCLPVGLVPEEVGEGARESVRCVCGVGGEDLAECLGEGAGVATRDACEPWHWKRVYSPVVRLLT